MAASEYDHRPGGSLKFKGGADKKKKKKSSTTERIRETAGRNGAGNASVEASSEKAVQDDIGSSDETHIADRGDAGTETSQQSPEKSSKGKASSTSAVTSQTLMTESERRYDEVRRKRLAEKVRKEAQKSHKDRVSEFNQKLERMSEHHDMPRIGPG